MTREKQVEQMIVETLQRFSNELSGYKVYLFGSRANNSAKERSDFDIGILGDAPFPVKNFYAIEDAFDDLPTLYKIDLVDLNRVSPAFKEFALKDARIIYG